MRCAGEKDADARCRKWECKPRPSETDSLVRRADVVSGIHILL